LIAGKKEKKFKGKETESEKTMACLAGNPNAEKLI